MFFLDGDKQKEVPPEETAQIAFFIFRDFLLKEYGSEDEARAIVDPTDAGVIDYSDFEDAWDRIHDIILSRQSGPADDVMGMAKVKLVCRELDVDNSKTIQVDDIFDKKRWRAEEEAIEVLRNVLLTRFGKKYGVIGALDENASGDISQKQLEDGLVMHGLWSKFQEGALNLVRIWDVLVDDTSTGLVSFDNLLELELDSIIASLEKNIKDFRKHLVEHFGSEEECARSLNPNDRQWLDYVEFRNNCKRNDIRPVNGKDFSWFYRVLDVGQSGKISAMELFENDPAQDAARITERRRQYKHRGTGLLPEKPVVKKPAPKKKSAAQGHFGSALQKLKDDKEARRVRELEDLRAQLKSKVWTMSLAAVADLEDLALENGAREEETLLLPQRIATLEKAVFGSSASAHELAKLKSQNEDYTDLKKKYDKLLRDYQDHLSQPPEIVALGQGDDAAQQSLEQMRTLSEKCVKAQSSYSKTHVEKLQLDFALKELRAEHRHSQEESSIARKQDQQRYKRLQDEHKHQAEELLRLKAAYGKLPERNKFLEEENERLNNAFAELRQSRDPVIPDDTLKSQLEVALLELNSLKAEHEELQAKHAKMKVQIHGAWGEQTKKLQTAEDSVHPVVVAFGEAPVQADQQAPSATHLGEKSTIGPHVQKRRPSGEQWAKSQHVSFQALAGEATQGLESSSQLPRVDAKVPGRAGTAGLKVDLGPPKSRSSPALQEKRRPESSGFRRWHELQGKVTYCDEQWREWCFANIAPDIKKGKANAS
eukprot:TRINITY_DN7316_c0_g1_i2.p1 TRINITY_DN7316_c0_g1~~TRINITY_DN7316_c0_g1_i2.p1  ORF type:complete len:767 (-),score=179.68 TRINITY_DN7316_c0_g1_i2:1528-3828(-)